VDNDGNFTFSEVVLVKITGKFKFTAYPNPASNKLTVEFSEAYRNGRITLLNSDGKRVLTQNITGFNRQVLEVSSLAAGMYVVEIKAANGEKQQQKVLIERN
jgi:hypothetical protein